MTERREHGDNYTSELEARNETLKLCPLCGSPEVAHDPNCPRSSLHRQARRGERWREVAHKELDAATFAQYEREIDRDES